MRDWDEPKYPISVSSAVAGQKLATGRAWYGDGWLFSRKDQKARKPGATALVSGRSVLAHAIAARAVAALSISPKLACKAARDFTDFSDPADSPGFKRQPGELFAGSFTYLVVYPDSSTRIIRTGGVEVPKRNKQARKRETAIEKPTVESLLFGIGQREGCWVLPLDFIVKNVVDALDDFDLSKREAA